MDKNYAVKTAEQYVKFLISREFKIKDAYLFGSFVNNNYNDDSDIDIAISIECLMDEFNEMLKLMKIRRDFDTRIEPHIFDADDFNLENPFVSEIIKTGIRLH